jgi:hypothetical protein
LERDLLESPELIDFLGTRSVSELKEVALRLGLNSRHLPTSVSAAELAHEMWPMIDRAPEIRSQLAKLIQSWNQNTESRYRKLALAATAVVDLAELLELEDCFRAQTVDLHPLYLPVSVFSDIDAGSTALTTNMGLRRMEQWRSRAGRPMHLARSPGSRLGAKQLMNEASRLIILGDPGSGKSTLLRWMARAYMLRLEKSPEWSRLPAVKTLPEQDWLPIYIRCRDLDEQGASGVLDDMLEQSLRKLQPARSELEALVSLLRSKVERGEALLLIDGVDEIAAANKRREFCEAIGRLSEMYRTTPMVLTSRIVGYRELHYRIGHGFEHLTMADLRSEDKDEFVKSWCALTEPPGTETSAARDLIRYIHENDGIERLTGNPTLLTTVALLKHRSGRLPRRKSDFYSNAMEVLLNWRRSDGRRVETNEALPQLEFVSWQMCFERREQIREDEMLRLLVSLRKQFPDLADVKAHEPKEFLDILEKRTAIISQTGRIHHLGREVPVFEFRHLTFQEFLAGLALVDGTYAECEPKASLAERLTGLMEHPEVLRDGTSTRAGVNSWREVLRTCVSVAAKQDADAALMAVLGVGIPIRARAILAATCLADEPAVSDETTQTVLAALSSVIDRNDGLRIDPGDETDMDRAIAELARGPSAGLVREALATEFARRPPREREPVARVYASACRDASVREAVQRSIGRSAQSVALALDLGVVASKARERSQTAISRLLELLTYADATVQAVMWGLLQHRQSGWTPNPQEAARVMSALGKTDNEQTLEYGGRVLEDLSFCQIDEKLVQKLSSPPISMQITAAQVLGRIGALSTTLAEPLRELFGHDNPDAKIAALWALGRIGTGGVITSMLDMEKIDASLLRAAVLVLARLADSNDGQAEAPLLALLQSEVVEVRWAALRELRRRMDWYDEKLLTVNLNGLKPYLGQYSRIDTDRLMQAASDLAVTPDEARKRYETLAARFQLLLSWSPQNPAADITRPRRVVFRVDRSGARWPQSADQ